VRRYARRYGLFTLVGIAGEDDVDAPDLGAPTQQPLGRERLKPSSNGRLDSEDGSGGPGGGGRGSGRGGPHGGQRDGLLSNLKSLAESGAISRPSLPRISRIGAPPLSPHDLRGSMQKPRSENRLQPSWDYRGLSKPAKNEAPCRLAPQTRCGRLWGKSRPRKMLARSGTCRGTRGSG
jgi:hypothetical protein